MWANRFAGALGPGSQVQDRDTCRCPEPRGGDGPVRVLFHGDRQDTSGPAWAHLLTLIEEAAADQRESFTPFAQLTAAERRQIVTLPASIGTLTQVRHLVLYGTNLVRIPPQIGAMTSLEVFEPYTSRRLHWYPYELTRCTRLRDSTVSTSVLYGNIKLRSPFPQLRRTTTRVEADFAALDPGVWGADAISTCSVCDGPVTQLLHQVWISLRLGTDVLPLLVNACSPVCLNQLPASASDHVPGPHTGGPSVHQPPPDWGWE